MNTDLSKLDVFAAVAERDVVALKALNEHFADLSAQVKSVLDRGVSPDDFTRVSAAQQALDAASVLSFRLQD
ncbi:MAG: hypothetical protein IJ228_10675 [Succinivibrio sp.]|nr:hypothetical protein [Succinivibrio sp.]